MITIISFVVVLGILIFIHELGHFAVAKWCGVGVEKFSLGFGPRLLGFTRGETEYRVSLLPLGGYVKMVGEHVDDEVSEEDRNKSFTHKPLRSRMAIVVAGPVMNVILAMILFPIIFMIGVSVPAFLDEPPVVGFVTEGEAAEKAGLENGDLILQVNGTKVDNWEALSTAIGLSPERELKLVVDRNGELIDKMLIPESSKIGIGIGGFYPPMNPVVGGFSSDFPAEKSGMEVGDRILAIDGTRITHWVELEKTVRGSSKELTFLVERGGEELIFKLTPKHSGQYDVYQIGISRLDRQTLKKYSFFPAIKEGVTAGVSMTVKLVVVLKGLVVGEYSLKTLGGPIMIAQVTGKAAQSGIADLLFIMAFLSLQLGIINLFPIPVLDGGHLLFMGVEAASGRPLSDRFMSISQQVGFVLLISLMLFVTWNDIWRILSTWSMFN